MRGAAALVEASRRCFASLFTDRAIGYRLDNGFDHFKVALSVAVMQMVRSDIGASGVIFTLDTETGFRDVVFVTGGYGLGENVVQGAIDPDEFHVHKPTFRQGFRAVLRRRLGAKQLRMTYGADPDGMTRTQNKPASQAERERFCLTDQDVLTLADYAIAIEDHYSPKAGRPTPMDIEWAKDGEDGTLYIVQARPETVASRRAAETLETLRAQGIGDVLVVGRAVGEKIATGIARVVTSSRDLDIFRPGEVLVAETTTPDWEPVMKTAAAIVTDRGGRTCHAAIVARELGVPAVVGTGDATAKLRPAQTVTVSCAEGEVGRVYEGAIPLEAWRSTSSTCPRRDRGDGQSRQSRPGVPHRPAAERRRRPGADGIHHPRAHRRPPDGAGRPRPGRTAQGRAAIAPATRGHEHADGLLRRAAGRKGVGTIAAGVLSAAGDRPALGLQDQRVRQACSAARRSSRKEAEPHARVSAAPRATTIRPMPTASPWNARPCGACVEEMGLTNLKVMVPFCRREEEARRVLAAMERHGLTRGEDGLEVFVMCEIPNNVIRIDAFAELFDGFSIGSNDLTQLTLGVDRDSEIVAFDFDERDPGVMEMLRLAITGAKRNGRHVGICGEAPGELSGDRPALVEQGIDSISVNPSSLIGALKVVADAEHQPVT